MAICKRVDFGCHIQGHEVQLSFLLCTIVPLMEFKMISGREVCIGVMDHLLIGRLKVVWLHGGDKIMIISREKGTIKEGIPKRKRRKPEGSAIEHTSTKRRLHQKDPDGKKR